MTSASRCRGANIKCFLDGKLIHDVKLAADEAALRRGQPGEARERGDPQGRERLGRGPGNGPPFGGSARVRPTATAIVLASDKPEDENTLEQPTKVKPVTLKLNDAGAAFRHTFPANSVTVLRLKLQ